MKKQSSSKPIVVLLILMLAVVIGIVFLGTTGKIHVIIYNMYAKSGEFTKTDGYIHLYVNETVDKKSTSDNTSKEHDKYWVINIKDRRLHIISKNSKGEYIVKEETLSKSDVSYIVDLINKSSGDITRYYMYKYYGTMDGNNFALNSDAFLNRLIGLD